MGMPNLIARLRLCDALFTSKITTDAECFPRSVPRDNMASNSEGTKGARSLCSRGAHISTAARDAMPAAAHLAMLSNLI
jgi:hypothetical protein